MYQIVRKETLGTGLKLMEVLAPETAKKAQPGQFVMLRIDERGERIPLTVADFNREAGTITVIFQEVGKTTQLLGEMNAGDYLLDFVGPLGQPSEIEKYGRVVCIGGGVGVAPIYPIARALSKAGNEVIGIIGARSQDLVILEKEMAEISNRLLLITDDGSVGLKGKVTDALQKVVDEGQPIDLVFAIGPLVMMEAVAAMTKPLGIKTLVSLNPIMVDGTGMCGACRVVVGGETRFACVDGPDFDGHLVDWQIARRRLAMFRNEEKQAMEAHHPHGGECRCR